MLCRCQQPKQLGYFSQVGLIFIFAAKRFVDKTTIRWLVQRLKKGIRQAGSQLGPAGCGMMSNSGIGRWRNSGDSLTRRQTDTQ